MEGLDKTDFTTAEVKLIKKLIPVLVQVIKEEIAANFDRIGLLAGQITLALHTANDDE